VSVNGKQSTSARNLLAITQGVLVAALGAIAIVSWFTDALRADVLTALVVQSDNPDAAEVVLASMRQNAAHFYRVNRTMPRGLTPTPS